MCGLRVYDNPGGEAAIFEAESIWSSSFAPFESLIFTSIIVPQASFIGHLSGIIVGYSIAWALIHGMNSYWAVSMLGWLIPMFILSLKCVGVLA